MQIYRCFSNPLKEFLMKNGKRYILIAKDCVTNKTFWLFEKDEKLEKLLNIWKENSPVR